MQCRKHESLVAPSSQTLIYLRSSISLCNWMCNSYTHTHTSISRCVALGKHQITLYCITVSYKNQDAKVKKVFGRTLCFTQTLAHDSGLITQVTLPPKHLDPDNGLFLVKVPLKPVTRTLHYSLQQRRCGNVCCRVWKCVLYRNFLRPNVPNVRQM